MTASPTLYDAAGGRQAIERLAAAQYRRCLADPLLAELFGPPPRPEHVEHLADWLGEVLGGPKRYTERHGGHPALLRHHANLAITEPQRERFVAACMAAVDEAKVPDDARLRRRLHEYFEWGTKIAREVSQPGAKLGTDEPVPVWGWGD